MNYRLLSVIVLWFAFSFGCSHFTDQQQNINSSASQIDTELAAKPGEPIQPSVPQTDNNLQSIGVDANDPHKSTGSAFPEPRGPADAPAEPTAQTVPGEVGDVREVAISNADEGLDEGDTAPTTAAATAEDTENTENTEKNSQQIMDEALEFCDVAQSYWQNGELDNALLALDNAYALILDVDTSEEDKLFQQKEDLRFLISKRILEIYASRNIVVNGHYDEIPLEMNHYIQSEIKRFTTGGERRFFEESYQRSGQYRPYIAQALKEAGLPEELSWLPLIESGFKTKALSRARALGLWQFIPSTGYKFGLQRNRYVDERMDFVKATDAAIAYLKALHNIFGDWATVLAAYNCGEGRVLHVIRTQNINYLDNFWDLYERLPMETARYVPRFFATLHIVKNLADYGMQDLTRAPSLAFDTVTINREIRLQDVAAATQIHLETLSALNPELRYRIIPPQEYHLKIPKGYLDDGLSEKLAAIPTTRLPQQAYVWHVVRSGDTLSTIAQRYGSSVHKIMQANNLRSSHFIRAGKRLKVPKKGYSAGQVASAATAPVPASGIHWVRKGDSLWKIASRYGVTVQQIMSINGLTSSDLYIGQQLKITASQTAPLPDPSEIKSYLVQKGDSPYTIAQRHNMALDHFLRINQLTPNSRIYPGQKLAIE